jgi:hypothetical protein
MPTEAAATASLDTHNMPLIQPRHYNQLSCAASNSSQHYRAYILKPLQLPLLLLLLQVCSRLGLQLGFKVLESGRYCLAWPQSESGQQHPLTAAGEACVLDVYGKGALLTVKEVSHMQQLSHVVHAALCSNEVDVA